MTTTAQAAYITNLAHRLTWDLSIDKSTAYAQKETAKQRYTDHARYCLAGNRPCTHDDMADVTFYPRPAADATREDRTEHMARTRDAIAAYVAQATAAMQNARITRQAEARALYARLDSLTTTEASLLIDALKGI